MALRAQTFICTCLEHYHNSPKIETIHMSINKCKDKQNVVCPCNGILFSHKMNETSIHVASQMNHENIILSEKKPDTKGHMLHDSMYVKYPKEVNPRDKKKVDGCQGLGERMSNCLVGTGTMKMLWN